MKEQSKHKSHFSLPRFFHTVLKIPLWNFEAGKLCLNAKAPLLVTDRWSQQWSTFEKGWRWGRKGRGRLKRKKEAAYANESMCREWREPRQRYPESTQQICGKVIGADWGRGGLPGWIDSLSLSISLSLSSSPSLVRAGLLCGGAGELIIGAVKPPHSLVSVSNEVPAIKAL